LVKLRRLARLNDADTEAERLLAEVDLTPITAELLQRASRIEPPEVCALDAIHLTTAIELHDAGSIAALLTYDHQLQTGCRHHGIRVEAPAA
jgi:predicted nucleic acid-binding protein